MKKQCAILYQIQVEISIIKIPIKQMRISQEEELDIMLLLLQKK